jgi:hypothetical protein
MKLYEREKPRLIGKTTAAREAERTERRAPPATARRKAARGRR